MVVRMYGLRFGHCPLANPLLEFGIGFAQRGGALLHQFLQVVTVLAQLLCVAARPTQCLLQLGGEEPLQHDNGAQARTHHNDARRQGWGWLARVVLYLSGGVVGVLAALVMLGVTQAARWLFVGIGAVLAVIVLAFGALAVAAGVIALRDRDDSPPDDRNR